MTMMLNSGTGTVLAVPWRPSWRLMCISSNSNTWQLRAQLDQLHSEAESARAKGVYAIPSFFALFHNILYINYYFNTQLPFQLKNYSFMLNFVTKRKKKKKNLSYCYNYFWERCVFQLITKKLIEIL